MNLSPTLASIAPVSARNSLLMTNVSITNSYRGLCCQGSWCQVSTSNISFSNFGIYASHNAEVTTNLVVLQSNCASPPCSSTCLFLDINSRGLIYSTSLYACITGTSVYSQSLVLTFGLILGSSSAYGTLFYLSIGSSVLTDVSYGSYKCTVKVGSSLNLVTTAINQQSCP